MATVMEMPKLSDTMKEGAIAKWLKKEGDKISAGLPVVEIETDKATMEYESPTSGTILKILVGDKGTCNLQDPIAVIGKPDENWQDALKAYQDKKSAKLSTTSATAKTPQAPTKAPTVSTAAPSAATLSAVNLVNVPSAQADTNSRVKASPLAKKIANDKGINLNSVAGTGPGGRIVSRDLDNVTTTNTQPALQSTTVIPVSMMRKTIAKRLAESVSTAPHFFLTISLKMDNLLTWRKEVVASMPPEQKFSVNDLIIFLLSRALKKHPEVNSSWKGDTIEQYNNVHIGIAVALPNGLVTPVVRNCEALSLGQIAQQSKTLIALARDGKLQSDAYAGGTFTISNLGMSGIEEFTAIINPPQAAILAVGATIPTPVVNASGAIVVEQRMKITLSCDHRVIDGAVGSEFLKTFKRFMEEPMHALFFG